MPVEMTALHFAVQNNNIELIKILMQNEKINVNIPCIIHQKQNKKYEFTALHLAIYNKNIEIVKILMQNLNLDVNIKYNADLEEKAALHMVIENKNIEIAKLLLQNECIDVNAKCKCIKYYEFIEKTALHMAIENKNIEFVELLLQNKKIDVNAKYKSKSVEKTALHIAVEDQNIDICKLLMQNGKLDINSMYIVKSNESSSGYSYDMYDQDRKEYSYYEHDIYEEKTALHIAINKKNIDIATLLILDERINVNIAYKYKSILKTGPYTKEETYDEKLETALHIAVEKGITEIVELLVLNKNIDINAKYISLYQVYEININDVKTRKESYYHEDTSLHIAVNNSNIKIVQTLLKNKKINKNAKDGNNNTPIELCKNSEIYNMLTH